MVERVGQYPRAEFALLDLHKDMNQLEKLVMKHPIDQLKRGQADHTRLTQEEVEKVMEAAKAAQSSAVWSTLAQVGACVLALFNIAAGGVLISTETDMVAGAALVASGFLALANLAITEKGWNWIAELFAGENQEKKERLLIILPLIISFMSLLLGASAYYKGVQHIMEANQILETLQQLATLAGGGFAIGKAFSEVQVGRAKIGVTDVEKRLFVNDKERDTVNRTIEVLMRMFKQISDAIKKSAREAISLAQSTTKV